MRYLLAFLLLCQSAYAADPLLIAKIVQCESSGRNVRADGRFLCADDGDRIGPSYGIAQFKRITFQEFAVMSIKERTWPFKAPNWHNREQQLFLLSWGLNHGYARRWTCWRKITKGE